MGAGAGSFNESVNAATAEDVKAAFDGLPAEDRDKVTAALKVAMAAPVAGDAQIEFGHIAREWRMKYEENGLKGGAVELDKLFKEKYLPDIKKIDGLVSVQRAVCGGCNDFKLVIKLKKDKFGDWEASKFAPEEAFLEDAKKIAGITGIETQPYTFEALDGSKLEDEQDKETGACGGEQIEFGHIAREWRMKYAENKLKGGAVELDKMFKEKYLPDIQKIDGFVSVQRAVCGGCNDFKIAIKVKKGPWGDWEAKKFAPEEAFVEDAKKVAGVTAVETQAYTFEVL